MFTGFGGTACTQKWLFSPRVARLWLLVDEKINGQ
jgi:hypothetical protein